MEKMKCNEEVHDHCTRQKSDIHIQFCRTTLLKNSNVNVGVKLYNKLPNTAFFKLWSADHKWSSGSALVVLLD